ncbi:hypothetical protein CEXT_170731 [Caerostris extrusa]|uniref:Cytochrome P450 n=1 Tax=Caerostris extrusa TaxID=172846 RepID=A0AAV4TC57_CAEEX|nr:hypothetical protein CEXT_170731 [Caerostris extrusa]
MAGKHFKNKYPTRPWIPQKGHDTTAMTLSWTLYCLGVYPEVQNVAFEEINDIFSDDPDRNVTREDLTRMKYMECVIKHCSIKVRLLHISDTIGSSALLHHGSALTRSDTISSLAYCIMVLAPAHKSHNWLISVAPSLLGFYTQATQLAH